MDNGLFRRIKRESANMTENRRAIVDYLAKNWAEAAFLSARRLAEETDTSESMVVRAAYQLGYDTYGDLQAELQQMVMKGLNKLSLLDAHDEVIPSDDDCYIERLAQREANSLQSVANTIDRRSLERAGELISEAPRIAVIGWRNAGAIAALLSSHLHELLHNVVNHRPHYSHLGEVLLGMEPGDALIAVSFRRYARQTVEAARLARKQGLSVIAITDSITSPIAEHATVAVPVSPVGVSFTNSHVTTVFVINLLLQFVVHACGDDCARRLADTEDFDGLLDVRL